MDKVLYFPYISVPNSPWMIKTLLYWDSVGSIVPYEYLYHPERLDTHMRELVQGGLVTQVTPGRFIHRIPRFKDSFIEFIERNPNTSRILKRQSLNLTQEVHLEKLDDLARELVRMRVAERVEGEPWYRLEKTVAYYFMTYLATSLGVITEFQPITDSPRGLSNITSRHGQNWGGRSTSNSSRRNARVVYRAKILDQLLPGPSQIESFTDLIDFKHRYGDELIRFRNFVEEFLLDLETNPSSQHDERIQRFLIRVDQDKSELIARMREYRWRQIGFGTLCVLAASLIPVLGNAGAGDSYFGAFDAALGVGSAVAAAFNTSQLQNMQQNPLAYAVLVDQKLPFRVHASSGTTFYEMDNQNILRQMFR